MSTNEPLSCYSRVTCANFLICFTCVVIRFIAFPVTASLLKGARNLGRKVEGFLQLFSNELKLVSKNRENSKII